MWSGAQALQRGLVDQLGGLHDAVKLAAADARLGDNYSVRYVEKPLSTFQRLLLNASEGNGTRILAALGLKLPGLMTQWPSIAPELRLLRHAQAGKPQIYSYCFCGVR